MDNNNSAEVDAVFDAFESIDQIARAILTGDHDHIPLTKAILYIAGNMLSTVDAYREQLAEDQKTGGDHA